jgi:hypothetical protein
MSIDAHQRLFVRGSSRVLSQLDFFYFISSEVSKEPENFPASVGGVAVLAPVARIGHPSSFLQFVFSFFF